MRLNQLLTVLSLMFVPAVLPGLAMAQSSSSSSTAVSFETALNTLRAGQGLRGLQAHPVLTAAAQAHAADMASNGYFSHTGRNGSTAIARARAAGCRGGYSAENIAWGQDSVGDAFNGWVASPPHYANMIGRNYGVYGLAESGGYWVMMFAEGC